MLETGLRRHLEGLGFTRRAFEFHRARGPLIELVTLSVRTPRQPPGQRIFWLIASVAAAPPRARLNVDYETWDLELGFDASDFAVGLTERLHQRLLPALAAQDAEATALEFERWHAIDDAARIWRALGKDDEAARVELRAPPPPGDENAPF